MTLFLGLTLLPGCQRSNPVFTREPEIVENLTKPVEIAFWHSMVDVQKETLIQMTEQFMSANPNIVVNLKNHLTSLDLRLKLSETTIEKDLPTLVQANSDWLLFRFRDNQVVDLQPYLQHKTLGFRQYDDISQYFRDAVVFDEKILGMPFSKSTEVIWYNQDIFDELKLEVPTTYAELAKTAKIIHEVKGISGCDWENPVNFYITYLKNKGIEFDSQLDFTRDESEEALDYYLKGIKGGYFTHAQKDLKLFESGNAAMVISTTDAEPFLKSNIADQFKLAVAPYPAEYSLQQGADIYLFSSATPNQRTAAFEYLKFLAEKDIQLEWAINTGYLPIYELVIDDEAYQKSTTVIAPIAKH